MIDPMTLATDLAWPMTVLIAWLAGELGFRWLKLPRISVYAIAGFVLAPSQTGLLPATSSDAMLLLANIAFGLILFEAGHRINLRWLRVNRWLGVMSLTESVLTFIAVYALSRGFELSTTISLLLAALAMATSPATVIRVVNEQHGSGQVTERALHLSVFNSVLAVFAFKVIVGLVVLRTSGNMWQAVHSSLIALFASVVLGSILGVVMPALLRAVGRADKESTLAFAIAVIFLVALTHSLKLSPMLATLTFGLVVRYRQIVLNPSQRGFGTLGELLSVFLFVYIATTLEWQKVVAGLGIGLAIIAVRLMAKLVGISLFAQLSGITLRKGLLSGLAMMPISAFVILVLEQTRHLGIDLVDQLVPLAAAALVLEIIGPVLTQRALILAHETPAAEES